MPEVSLQIGGRSYQVACQEGEEVQLTQAAALLDAEATALVNSAGRVPESRMLLMAGLMLADRMIELAHAGQAAEAQVRELQARLADSDGGAAPPPSDGVSAEQLAEAHAVAESAFTSLVEATERVERLVDALHGR